MKRSRLNPISKKRRARSGVAGKLGIVRLYGKDLKKLRRKVYARDEGCCQWTTNGVKCGKWLPFEGDVFHRAHLAHFKNKRNWGDIDNTRILCYLHHIIHEHCYEKPCPPKASGGN